MKKRIKETLLLLACGTLFATAAGSSYLTSNHYDSVHEDKLTLSNDVNHTHDYHGEWTAVDDVPMFARNGNYYLDTDLEISSEISISGYNVVLCLNGYSITASDGYTGYLLSLSNSGFLTLFDCENDDGTAGSIANDNTGGSTLYIDNSSFFYMYGGLVSGDVTNEGSLIVDDGYLTSDVTNSGTYYVTDGYIDGSVNSSGTASVTGGYLTTVAHSTYADYVDDDYIAIDISEWGTTLDTDYLEEYPFAVYLDGGSIYLSNVRVTCGDEYNPLEEYGYAYIVTYENVDTGKTGEGFPSEVGTYLVTYGSGALDLSTKTYYYSLAYRITINHDIVEAVYKTNATCENDGSTSVVTYCEGCGEVFSENVSVVEAIGHDYSNEFTITDDYHWVDCAHGCGSILDFEAHSYGEWVVVTEATEESEGEQYHVCTVCGYVESEVISTLTSTLGLKIAAITCGIVIIELSVFLVCIIVIHRKREGDN